MVDQSKKREEIRDQETVRRLKEYIEKLMKSKKK